MYTSDCSSVFPIMLPLLLSNSHASLAYPLLQKKTLDISLIDWS